jgi:hypothetical protein
MMGIPSIPLSPLTTDKALQEIARLHADVDAEAAHLFERHRGRLKCRNGCSGCCADDLTVFAVEAELIRAQHPALLFAGRPHPAGQCAFLDDQESCRIYAARPYVCRTQGLPLRWIETQPDGTSVELRDICPLNDGDEPIEALPDEACWAIGPFERRLAQLQAGADGGKLRRVALRSLFGSTPNL